MFILNANIKQEERWKAMLSIMEAEKFDFLKKIALEMGAAEAKIIPADKVVVEDRILLKCKVGCSNYGKTLACPPYAPTPEEFRKIVKDSKATADQEVAKYLSKSMSDPTIPHDIKEKLQHFWDTWKADKLQMLSTVIAIEKAALNKGYPLAVGLVSGECQLCEKCTLDKATCVHPTKARYSEDGVGVNVKATAKNAGIQAKFPFDKNPASFALVLID
jgi:predicted metal-binding protein